MADKRYFIGVCLSILLCGFTFNPQADASYPMIQICGQLVVSADNVQTGITDLEDDLGCQDIRSVTIDHKRVLLYGVTYLNFQNYGR